MSNDQRTLTLKVAADIEVARNQLNGLVGVVGDTATKVDASLSKMDAGFASIGKGLTTGKAVLAGFIGGIAEGLTEKLAELPSLLIEASKNAIEFGKSVAEGAAKVGIGTDFLQEFRYAVTEAGGTAAKADISLGKFSVTLGKAADGNKVAAGAFTKLGVDIADASGNLRPTETVLRDVIDAISKISDPARQSSDAMAIFGRTYMDIMPVLKDGPEGLSKTAEAMRALGISLSPEEIGKLDELGKKMINVKEVISVELAAAIGDNADAIIGIGQAAANAIEGVAGLFQQMKAISLLYSQGDFSSMLTNSKEQMQALASPKGVLDYADKKLAAAKNFNPFTGGSIFHSAGQVANAQAFRDDVMASYLNDTFPIAGASAGAKAGGKVIPPPTKLPPKPKAAKAGPAPYDLEGNVAGLLANPAKLSKDIATAESALSGLDGSATTLAQTLNDAFDTRSLNDLVQKVPDLSRELDQAHSVGQAFTQDLAQGITDAITSGQKLGDVLVNTFARIGTSILSSGILNFLSGGTQGVSFGTAFSGISSIFGGKFAAGGDPPPGRISLVGEQGPELFVPKSAGTIIPNHALRAGVASNGGGNGGGMVYNDFRGTIMTEDLYKRIDATGVRAAQAGAMGGAQMAAAQRARSARRSL